MSWIYAYENIILSYFSSSEQFYLLLFLWDMQLKLISFFFFVILFLKESD